MRFDKRRRTVLVEGGKKHVRRHDGGDARVDRRLERHELDLAQPLGRMLDQRQLEVRVGARVAVPGKMLAARRDPFGLQRPDDGGAQPRDLLGFSASARSPMTGFFGLVWTSSTGA